MAQMLPTWASADPAGDAGAVSAAAATQNPPPALAPTLSADQMRMVLEVSRLLAVPTDLDALLVGIAEAACALLGCERTSIFLHDPATNELWTKVALGVSGGEIRVPVSAGIVGYAFCNNEPVQVLEPYKDPRFNPGPDRKSGFVTRNLLTAPMVDLNGRPLGVIQAVNKQHVPFSPIDTALVRLLAEQAGVAVQRHRLQVAAVEIISLRHEMDLARKAQEALIPKGPPHVPGLEAAGWCQSASMTGGDCFDLWKLPDGRMGIFVADASGHGLAPALVVSQARTLVRALCEIEPDPHRLLRRVNARLADDLEWGQFVTAFLGFLDPATGLLHWSSAGHGPVLMRPRCDAPLAVLDAPVQPLGVVGEWFEDAPPPAVLEATGALIVVTDGLFEAPGRGGERFGIGRMRAVLDEQRDCKPHELIDALRRAVRAWQGTAEPADDQTIVAVQRDAAAHPAG